MLSGTKNWNEPDWLSHIATSSIDSESQDGTAMLTSVYLYDWAKPSGPEVLQSVFKDFHHPPKLVRPPHQEISLIYAKSNLEKAITRKTTLRV